MNFKNKMQKIWAQIWELIKMSLAPAFMYLAMSFILVLLAFGETIKFSTAGVVWWAVCFLASLGYNGIIAYMQGNAGFEMLVSGNMRRMSEMSLEGGYKMSRYREAKEYRAWKGFVSGAFLTIFPMIGSIVFACNQSIIDAVFTQQQTASNPSFGWVFVIFLLLSGWSNILFLLINSLGFGVSYLYGLFFAVLPLIINGVLYILGAYGKRRKTLREQELRDRASQEQASPKKVNYGGLPGTKPKKRK